MIELVPQVGLDIDVVADRDEARLLDLQVRHGVDHLLRVRPRREVAGREGQRELLEDIVLGPVSVDQRRLPV